MQATSKELMTEILGKLEELQKTVDDLRVENSTLYNRVCHVSTMLEVRQPQQPPVYPPFQHHTQSSFPSPHPANTSPRSHQVNAPFQSAFGTMHSPPPPMYIVPQSEGGQWPMYPHQAKFNHHHPGVIPQEAGYFPSQMTNTAENIFSIAAKLLTETSEIQLHDFTMMFTNNITNLGLVVNMYNGTFLTPKEAGEKLLAYLRTVNIHFQNVILYVEKKYEISPARSGAVTTIRDYTSLVNALRVDSCHFQSQPSDKL